MKLRITEKNAALIEAALAAVNGRATAHACTDYGEVLWASMMAAKEAEDIMGTKRGTVGAVAVYVSGDAVTNAYAHKAFSRPATRLTLERRPSGWFLVHVEKADIRQSGGGLSLTLTAEQDAEAVRRLRERYNVAMPIEAVA